MRILFDGKLASIEAAPLDAVLRQLQQINDNLQALTTAIDFRSFWNSQLFAAIIGASAAILVLIIQQAWNWNRKRTERMEKVLLWIVAQHVFWGPKDLFEKASRSSYGHDPRDRVTGTQTVIKDKPLGEKMVIGLRTMVKFQRYPSFRLRGLFQKYEETLWRFNLCRPENGCELDKYLSEAEFAFKRIIDFAERHTGENRYTILR